MKFGEQNPIIYETPFLKKQKVEKRVKRDEKNGAMMSRAKKIIAFAAAGAAALSAAEKLAERAGDGFDNAIKKQQTRLEPQIPKDQEYNEVMIGDTGEAYNVQELVDKARKKLSGELQEKSDANAAKRLKEIRDSLQSHVKGARTVGGEGLSLKKNIEVKNIGDAFLSAYHEVASLERWPNKILNDDFFIGIQLQESNYLTNAVSKDGAVGTMQNTKVSINDIFSYLNSLKRKGEITFSGAKMFSGEDKLTKKELDMLEKLILKNPDYGRACGKLFFMVLRDKYGAGEKEYQAGDIEGVQEKLAAAYNAGYCKTKDKEKENWPGETRIYTTRVLENIENIKFVREQLFNNGLDGSNNYMAMLLVRDMNGVEKGKEDVLRRGIILLKNIYSKNPDIGNEKLKIVFEKSIIEPRKRKIFKSSKV